MPYSLIKQTENILLEYAKKYIPNEEMVYWAGIKDKNRIIVQTLIAPETETMWGRVEISHRANAEYVKLLNELDQIHLAQVHSHPSEWVDHSLGDDNMAAFKVKGLISIVVPEYGLHGMSPLTICGIHRLEKKFIRFSDKYIRSHFIVDKETQHCFVDLR